MIRRIMQRKSCRLNIEPKKKKKIQGGVHTYPDKYWQVRRVRSRVDIQEEAVLVSQGRTETVDLRQPVPARLRAQRGLVDGRDKAPVAGWRLRGLPSQAAD